MEQMKAFIEKARTDSELMAKLNTLAARGAGAGEIIALAAEHGVTITEEDFRQAVEAAGHVCPHRAGQSAAGCPSVEERGCTRKTVELKEEDLEAAAGGFTQNRYDPDVCGQYYKVGYNCVGFLGGCWCDHYAQKTIRSGHCRYKCAMGYYDYESMGAAH